MPKNLFFIALAALLMRLGFLWYWHIHQLEKIFLYDSHVVLAQHWLGWINNISEYELLSAPPIFALWCAFLLKLVGGPHFLLIRLMNCLFSSASCALLGLWTFQICRKPPAAYLAAGAMAFSPILIFFSPHLQSESFFLFFEILFFLALAKYWTSVRYGSALGLGLFFGLLCLTRSAFVVYLPFLAAILLWQTRKTDWKLVHIILLLIGFAAPVSIQTLLNWRTYHRFIPFTVQTGLMLYGGLSTSPEAPWNNVREAREEMRIRGIDHWLDQDKYLMDKAIAFIKENPKTYAKILVKKFFQYWRPWPYKPYPLAARIILGTTEATDLILNLMWSATTKHWRRK